MNCMEQVAKILGVELNEEFYIEDSDYKYKITKDGMKVYYGINDDWNSVNYTLGDILSGKREIKKPILDEKEKEYLSAVIAPFRDQIIHIVKHKAVIYEYIVIRFWEIGSKNITNMYFPVFRKDTMYKGMELNKEYSLEDLNL